MNCRKKLFTGLILDISFPFLIDQVCVFFPLVLNNRGMIILWDRNGATFMDGVNNGDG